MKFYLIHPDGNTSIISGTSAHEAANKAANKNFDKIILLQEKKLFFYEGK